MLHFNKNLTTVQVYGSGLALILIMQLVFMYTANMLFFHLSLALVILLMIWPKPFHYFGVVWIAFGEALGYIMSRVILSIVYVLFVIPAGLMKRKSLRKNMNLDTFKKDTSSLFRNREIVYTEKDFEKTF